MAPPGPSGSWPGTCSAWSSPGSSGWARTSAPRDRRSSRAPALSTAFAWATTASSTGSRTRSCWCSSCGSPIGATSTAAGIPLRPVVEEPRPAPEGQVAGELANDPTLLAWWATDAHRAGGWRESGAIAPVFLGDPRTGRTGTGEKTLDIDQIAIPALGESGPFAQPYDFRSPSRWNWDVTLFKNFSLGGDRRLQFRVGFFNLFNQAVPDVTRGDIDVNLETECNVRVDGVPNGAGGPVAGVCDPTQGFHFSDLTRENFGKIITKRGHRVIELALRFEF